MASVFETILKKIPDGQTCFVFPSETTAMLWARKICLHSDIRSVATERFLAWDRFKEVSIQTNQKNARPASSLIRRLFAVSLTRQNADSPFLSAVIPPEYAKSGEVFADSIAMTLSSLGRWEGLRQKSAAPRDDEEDRDLRIIKTKYAAFMQEHDLFEPSWEKAPFVDNTRYVIFFPETLADFSEYAELLNTPSVVFYSTKEFADEKPALLFYDSVRTEIRSAVLELRRLNEKGSPFEDMAITLPDYKSMAPYVERELSLHDIPFTRRAGSGLGLYPVGRLFSLIGSCVSSLFSFDTLKPLLLDNCIPWKYPEKNRALINYGIANHCVAPFTDRFRVVDAWEEGFRRNPDEPLSAYYKELKQSLTALFSAKSFRDINQKYFIFRSFLDMTKCGAENDAVLARCIEELSVLIETEEAFPGLVPEKPFVFFTSYLKDKNYVYAYENSGVNLYDYPVAAGAPFSCHFLLNASQSAASIQHKPLSFLRQDKRITLGIEDKDTSEPVLSLFHIAPWKDYSCYTRISASEKTFTGWAIPHSVFALNHERQKSAETDITNPDDLFTAERQWRAAVTKPSAAQDAANQLKPKNIYAIQREGFLRWNNILQSAGELPESGFITEVASLLRERIRQKNIKNADSADTGGVENTGIENAGVENAGIENTTIPLSVSATDLNDFFTCSAHWLYKRIFHLAPFLEDAALLDDEARGLIYHEILYRLFSRIKEKDTVFKKENISAYYAFTEEITKAVLQSDDTLRGPLVYPLLAPLAEAINKRIRWLLKTEACYFDGYEVKELEQRFDLLQGRLRLTGRIDRISLSPQGPVIIDYKSNTVPSKKDCRKDDEEEIGLKDFQMPMYIKLYESLGEKVSGALFISLGKYAIVNVVGELQNKRDPCSREEYQPSMEALEEAINRFDSAVSELNFVNKTIPYKTCLSCEYKKMCRCLYSL